MKRIALTLVLLAAVFAAQAQDACPHAADADQAVLLGLWRAEFVGQGHVGTILLVKHPEDEQSFRGTIDRNGDRREVAGDIDNGAFTLEESADGVHIAGTWLGDVVEGSCGKEIRGTWTEEGKEEGQAFVLRKAR